MKKKKKKTPFKKPGLPGGCSGMFFLASTPRRGVQPWRMLCAHPSPPGLRLNYLFLPPVPDTVLPRETKPIEPSHSDNLRKWKMGKEKAKVLNKDLFKVICGFSGMVLACLRAQCRASAHSDTSEKPQIPTALQQLRFQQDSKCSKTCKCLMKGNSGKKGPQ